MGTGAQNSFPQTAKEGVNSEMKIFVFGLATSNELRGGVTKKKHKQDGAELGDAQLKTQSKTSDTSSQFQQC